MERFLDYNTSNLVLATPSVQHGPCAAMSISGMAFDNAYCFYCKQWPHVALPWKQRCLLNH